MKPGELMIGDWVSYNDKMSCKITALCKDRPVFDTLLGHKNWRVPYEKLKPIPLTPEILEKNGFKKGFLPALKTESSLLWVANVGEDYIEIRFDRRNIAIWYDYDENNDDVYSDCLFPLPYWLHDFQHALKLCGINKEIEI